jgi:hypothetical protein
VTFFHYYQIEKVHLLLNHLGLFLHVIFRLRLIILVWLEEKELSSTISPILVS